MKIRCMVIDDEPLARQRVRLLLKDEKDIEIVREFDNGIEALAAITVERPDLLFLDVQMPEMDGFQMLSRVPADLLPVVIFTTAGDQHAIRAFDAHALDFLLKPIRPDRFQQSLTRARTHLADRRNSQAAQGLLQLLAAQGGASPPPPPHATPHRSWLARLVIKEQDKTVVLKTDDVDSIESAGNYVAVHVGKENHILRETLSSLESQLDPERFLRVSRGVIVNLDRVRELQPMFKGEHQIILHNGRRLPMTRGLREVEQALKFR